MATMPAVRKRTTTESIFQFESLLHVVIPFFMSRHSFGLSEVEIAQLRKLPFLQSAWPRFGRKQMGVEQNRDGR